jgi:L-fuconolactonase
MRIDSHQHFWRYQAQRDAWITEDMSALRRDFMPGDLLPELQGNAMEGCVAVQVGQTEEETLFLLNLAHRCSQIKGVVGWIDLRAPNLAQRLEYFSQFKKLRGFRHIVQSEPDDRFLLREDFCRGIGTLRRFGFTYDILVYPKQLDAVIEFAEKFPDQPFVLDHLAKPSIRTTELEPWAAKMKLLAKRSNVYCKVSGLVTEANWKGWRPQDFIPYLDIVFGAFGPDRLMFGSDWPVCLLAASYRQVVGLIEDYLKALPPDQRENILGRNAISFYGLEGAHHGSAA